MSIDVIQATFGVEIRVADTSERIIEGIVVPWNETSFMTPDPKGERFVPGSLSRSLSERGGRIKLFRSHQHDRAVGRALDWADQADGCWGQFQIASTAIGDEILSEVREGMLDSFSVGFRAMRTRRGDDGAREVLEAALHEVSILPLGAYEGARVLAMRQPATSGLPPMPQVDLSPLPALRR